MNLAPGASAALVFWRVGVLAEQWAKQNQLDLGAVRLTEERLNYTQTTYPCLDSLVKAARGRVLFEYVCKICLDVVHLFCKTILLLFLGHQVES